MRDSLERQARPELAMLPFREQLYAISLPRNYNPFAPQCQLLQLGLVAFDVGVARGHQRDDWLAQHRGCFRPEA